MFASRMVLPELTAAVEAALTTDKARKSDWGFILSMRGVQEDEGEKKKHEPTV